MPVVRRAVRSGVHFIQIREKDLSDRDLFALAVRVVSIASGSDCRVIVNGRADIAIAAGADGVHLPEGGLRPSDLRDVLRGRLIIGCSTHSEKAALEAQASGADYVLLSPVFATPSKAALGQPLGLDSFSSICRKLGIPVLALGGIDERRVPEVLRAGAAGVAGIRLFQARRRCGSAPTSSLAVPCLSTRGKGPSRPRCVRRR